jgi:hypothetical protein
MNGMKTQAKYFGIEQYKYKPFFLPEGNSLCPSGKTG